MTAKQSPKDQHKYSPEREKRVADALRENLRKRKAQYKPAQTDESDMDSQ